MSRVPLCFGLDSGPSVVRSLLTVSTVVLMLCVVSGNDDCDGDSSNETHEDGVFAPLHSGVVSSGDSGKAAFPGDEVWNRFEVTQAPPGGLLVTFLPPNGVDPADVDFVGRQPGNPDGPLPFEFAGVDAGDVVEARYPAPAVPDEMHALTFTAHFEAQVDEVTKKTFTCAGQSVRPGKTVRPGVASENRSWSGRPTAVRKDKLQEYATWYSNLWFYTHDQEMDTALCQQAAGLFLNPSSFLAVRFPLVEAIQGQGDAWQMPVLFDEDNSPQISLLRYSQQIEEVFVVPLEPRFDRMDFAANYLPQVQGERWFTLGGMPETAVSCPADLQIPGDEWEVYAEVHVDLGGESGTCSGCVFEAYTCFDNSKSMFRGALTALTGKSAVQHGSITCFGPFPIRMSDFQNLPLPPISVSGPGFHRTAPPAEVWFRHIVLNTGAQDLNAELTISSDLGLQWTAFGGSYDEPDMDDPLNSQVVLPGSYSSTVVWLKATIPDGLFGVDTVVFGVKAPAVSDTVVWNSSLLILESHPPDEGIELPVDPTPVGEVESDCP